MAAEVKCLGCGETLYETTPLDDKGNTALVPGTSPKQEYDAKSGRHYMQCPKCGAKNGFKTLPAPEGAGIRMALDKLLG
jgi:predicted nucleic-acid-binding Zn-ribbon protein